MCTIRRLPLYLLALLFVFSSWATAEGVLSQSEYLEAYRAQVRKHPKDLTRHRSLIAQAHRDKQLQVPLTIYGDSYQRNPDHPTVLYVLGYTYLVQGTESSLRKADQMLQRAVELKPGLADAHAALGLVSLKLGRNDEGAAALEHALELNPKFHQAILALARHYQVQHDYPQAVTNYQKALEIEGKSAKVRLELARTYRALKDYPQAILHTKDAIRHEKSGEAYYLLGQLHALQGEPDKAIGAYQRGREIAPNDTAARYQLAQIFLDQDNGRYAVLSIRSALAADADYQDVADRLKGIGIAEAGEKIADILAERPGNASLQLFLGKLRQKFGETSEAQKHLEAARDLEPGNSEVRAELGKVYESQNQPELAAQEYQQAVTLGSAEELALTRLAENQLAEEKYQEFLDTAKRLFAINPNHADLQSAVGDIYLGRYEEASGTGDRLQADKYVALALDHYDMASKLEPANAAYKLRLANLYASQNKLKALSIYEDVIALDPGNAEVYYSRAAFMLQYRFGAERALLYGLEDVLEDLQKAIELRPDYAEAHSDLGLAYEREGQAEDAVAPYEKAVQLNPDDLQAHSFLAHWYKGQGEYLKSIHSFRKLADAHSDDAEILKGFAFLTLTHNEKAGWRDAQKMLVTALDLVPTDADVLMNYGYTLYLEQKYSQAIKYYKRSLEFNPENALTHFNLALVYELTSQKVLASEEWQEVIELDYEGRYVDTAVERLAALGGQ